MLASAFACGSIYSAVADSFYGLHIAQRYGPDFPGNAQSIAAAPTLNNYLTVLGNFTLFTYIYNTFFIAAFVTVFKVLTSVLAAFAFIYYDFKYKETVFNSMLLTFFIPITVLIMPNYLLMSRLDLLNTPWGVMLPQFVDGMGVFLMRQTMRGIPKPLLEAAVLDNAGPLQVLRKVVLPLIKPSIIAVGILFFINSWNEYFGRCWCCRTKKLIPCRWHCKCLSALKVAVSGV